MNMEMQKIFNTLCKILGKEERSNVGRSFKYCFSSGSVFFSVIYRLKT